MGVNLALEKGYTCPSCYQDDICWRNAPDGPFNCICPSCCESSSSVENWIALTPVLLALNDEKVRWGFVHDGPGFAEVQFGDVWVEIGPFKDGWFAIALTQGPYSHEVPPEVKILDEQCFNDVGECVSWVLTDREGVR